MSADTLTEQRSFAPHGMGWRCAAWLKSVRGTFRWPNERCDHAPGGLG